MGRWLSLIWVIGILACSSKAPRVGDQAEWKEGMQGMAQSLGDLLPLIYDDRQFSAEENRKVLAEGLDRLGQSSHELKGDVGDPDPLLEYYRKNLQKDLRTARDGLNTGRLDYSQFVLKQVTGLCIQCHTRGQSGPEFSASLVQKEKYEKLPRYAKADLLAALRSVDESLAIYREILRSPDPKEKQTLKQRYALERALNLALRVKQDPSLATQIADEAVRSAPDPLSSLAKKWKVVLQDWPKSRWSKTNRYLAAKKLMDQADRARGYWGDDSGFASYLLASALLHDYLRTEDKFKKDPSAMGPVLYSLAHAYSNLSGDEDRDTALIYFKECIYKSPHTKVARDCYYRIESLTYFESSAGRYTDAVNYLDYLEYLKELAWPKGTKFQVPE